MKNEPVRCDPAELLRGDRFEFDGRMYETVVNTSDCIICFAVNDRMKWEKSIDHNNLHLWWRRDDG